MVRKDQIQESKSEKNENPRKIFPREFTQIIVKYYYRVGTTFLVTFSEVTVTITYPCTYTFEYVRNC